MVKLSKGINIPLNRAEGDLEISVEIAGGVITEAWSAGTLYRGFEGMMQGRGALDGLVMTPRVCGICSITHLTAAVEALDAIVAITPPDNARRLRNLALMVETIQSDVRQAILMFMVDFANRDAYRDHPLGDEAHERYAPLAGRSALQVIRESKRLVQVLAIIGGQWPHTSFMVPGGVTSIPEVSKILQGRMIVERFRSWYERSVLGCSVDRWFAIQNATDLDAWIDESPAHRDSEVGFFIRFARKARLDTLGKGPNRFLSYGNYPMPLDTAVLAQGSRLLAPGASVGTAVFPLQPEKISEDVSHSWYEQGGEPLHPLAGKTKPYAAGHGGAHVFLGQGAPLWRRGHRNRASRRNGGRRQSAVSGYAGQEWPKRHGAAAGPPAAACPSAWSDGCLAGGTGSQTAGTILSFRALHSRRTGSGIDSGGTRRTGTLGEGPG